MPKPTFGVNNVYGEGECLDDIAVAGILMDDVGIGPIESKQHRFSLLMKFLTLLHMWVYEIDNMQYGILKR